MYTWTALAKESKLIIAWRSGSREADTGLPFMVDVASRLAIRPQITTDGYRQYNRLIPEAFGDEVDWAQVLKMFREQPQKCVLFEMRPRRGQPDYEQMNTAYVERHNLTIRMGVRRLTRKTNAFSKKLERHEHMLAIFFVYYNFCRAHMTLGKTPAMAAGLAEEPYDLEWIVTLVEARTPPPTPRGPDRRPRKRRRK